MNAIVEEVRSIEAEYGSVVMAPEERLKRLYELSGVSKGRYKRGRSAELESALNKVDTSKLTIKQIAQAVNDIVDNPFMVGTIRRKVYRLGLPHLTYYDTMGEAK